MADTNSSQSVTQIWSWTKCRSWSHICNYHITGIWVMIQNACSFVIKGGVFNFEVYNVGVNQIRKLSKLHGGTCYRLSICLFPSSNPLMLPMLRLFLSKHKDAKIFEIHLNPTMLVSIGKVLLSTLIWVPFCQGFSHFSPFCIISYWPNYSHQQQKG